MTGLGKGLDALFGPVPDEEQVKENDTLKKTKNNRGGTKSRPTKKEI